ncbi:MAG TPA: YncE family protein [Candidatus Kapabacteria bacterium]|nr:YncE family protein [Candidatus Kapabacteria bacterium]
MNLFFSLIKRIALASSVLFCLCAPAMARNPIHYHLLKKVLIGGEGGWDYLSADPQHRKLYIAHFTQVDVYDLNRDKIIGHIYNTQGVHGIAIAERDGHGFISCGMSNSVLMFDLKTLDTIKRIPVGEHPDAIIYDFDTRHVFVMNAKSESITVLNGSTGALVATIPLPGKPEFAASDDHGHVYVNLEDKSEIVKISVGNNTVEKAWPVAPGEEPSALAMDRGRDRLFIGCANERMVIMDSRDGHVITSLPIGKGIDAAVFDPFTDLAFGSCGEGTTTIVREISADSFAVAQLLPTERGARTIELDTHTHDIYVVTAKFGPAPAATADHPHPRPSIIPGTFTLLKYGPAKH